MAQTMECLICSGKNHSYLYKLNGVSLWKCAECDFIFSRPHLTQDEIFAIYGKDLDPINVWTNGKTEAEASKRYLDILLSKAGGIHKILLVAPANHCFADLAQKRGLEVVHHFNISGFEQTKDLEPMELSLDAVIFLFQIDKSFSLERILNRAYELMKPNGILLIVTPSLDSKQARYLKSSWTAWRPENNYYFNRTTIQSLLWRYGFNGITIDKDKRLYTLAHMYDRVKDFPKSWLSRIVSLAYRLLPSLFQGLSIRLPTSGMVVTAKKTQRNIQPLLSVILPVYNEGATFPILMKRLLAKQIDGMAKEIIIVESNSTDDSRHLVLGYKDQPEVKIILQDKALGKGNAVREGIDHASGDILLIQDADLEYDLDDYEALLEPIVAFRKPFVLGSRHDGSWKMRHFNEQKHLAVYCNLGHAFLMTLVNVLYGQKLKDPFTMFKVFRRDCLYNLKLECNRFDFDIELVIKLIRKGYLPSEIPVNYNARSFKEGKKVNMFRDPITWIVALFKYRFVRIAQD